MGSVIKYINNDRVMQYSIITNITIGGYYV